MDEIIQAYSENIIKYKALVGRTEKRLLIFSLSRLFVFITAFVFLFLLWGVSPIIAVTVFTVFLVIFFILLKRFSKLSYKKTFYRNLLQINMNELKGMNDDHSSFYGGDEFIDPHHDFSHDLDLFGNSSLYQYLNRTCTGRGRHFLAEWLGRPYALSTQMTERQEAVAELSAKRDWRQQFNAYGMAGMMTDEAMNDFNNWLLAAPSFAAGKTYRVIRILMPILVIILFVLSIAGSIHYSLFILFFLINLLVISINLREINHIHALISGKHRMLKTLQQLMFHFEDHEFRCNYLKRLQDTLSHGEGPASKSLRQLSDIVHAFDSRLNLLMAGILNGFLLWDIQCIGRLDKWKRSASELLPLWFDKLGRADALCSLANYAGNNPDYCYPEQASDKTFLSAKKMGHPLIPARERVRNDFSISGSGEITIITGANMAGKSTFLRTTAVNMILAMTAAPVCAAKFVFSPCKVFSSMRTSDSLSDKESYFYAELKRLSLLKERLENKENILFLLDEILKGTNSKDKSEGSRLFTEQLVELKATGIIATHDVLLGKLADKYGQIKNQCFEIEIEGDEVKFDYLLREGMTTKMNAAILMKQMGII